MGRHSIYTEELAEIILDRLADGESLAQICKDDAMPGLRTVMAWAADNQDFSNRYARAREAQAEVMDDKILAAAKEASVDPQAARVKVEAYKWRAAKLAPKRYGDASTVKLADADGEKIRLDEVSTITRLTAIAAQINARMDAPDDTE